eukprot:TRINITY_DN17211_c0_g1_i1.p1 TRINITY_DN17211_c0_g1~~TRINITY_DN17211_c0_g1_i1.p1  ORF type:complete len:173 (-),score=32.23 TRINITY_DN17211_c0_g1_i1:86-604(-)
MSPLPVQFAAASARLPLRSSLLILCGVVVAFANKGVTGNGNNSVSSTSFNVGQPLEGNVSLAEFGDRNVTDGALPPLLEPIFGGGVASAFGDFVFHKHTNCYSGRGAVNIDANSEGRKMSAASCTDWCSQTWLCDCAVHHSKSLKCWRRTSCRIAACENGNSVTTDVYKKWR